MNAWLIGFQMIKLFLKEIPDFFSFLAFLS